MVTIFGKVIKGLKYGRKLGFPTANIDRRDYVRRKLKIKLGIYAGRVNIEKRDERKEKRKSRAAIVIGPIDAKGLPKLEAHLLNFKGNLYGKNLRIYLEKYIRPFKKFKNEEELKKQIAKDIKLIDKIK